MECRRLTSCTCANAAGSSTGQYTNTTLTRQYGGTWATAFRALRQENITAALTVAGLPAGKSTVTVAGVSPFAVNYTASLAAATLVSKGLAATDPVAAGGIMVVYVGENSYVNLGLQDLAGNRCVSGCTSTGNNFACSEAARLVIIMKPLCDMHPKTMLTHVCYAKTPCTALHHLAVLAPRSVSGDPGLHVVLTLIPAAAAPALLAQYGVAAARRRLLAANEAGSTFNVTNPTTGTNHTHAAHITAPCLHTCC